MHVVVVDDEPRMVELITGYLKENDVRTTGAHDGTSGLLAARQVDVDAVVLDLMLPGMSGTEVCKQLRREGNDVFGDRPIVTRLVVAVAATMTVVLLVAGAFVFWRVEYALNRQLNQDLNAYHAVVTRSLSTSDTPPADTPGQSYQVYDRRGRVIAGDARTRLVDAGIVAQAAAGTAIRKDIGSMIPPSERPYRVITSRVTTPTGPVVVASAISRRKHDEALRGSGFPPEFVGKAFDRFSRAESSRSSRGTGLGLSLVQAVAEAHGGTATIAGSRVTLDLPTGHPGAEARCAPSDVVAL